MFRSYARFGVVVQLMAALLAGIGVDYLRRAGTRRARIACLALVALAAGEYAVSPSALWRDVLPTTAHRWVARQPDRVRVLDCTPLNQESESVQWLTGDRVTLLGGSIERLRGAEPVPEACGERLHAPARAARHRRRAMVRRAPGAGRPACRRAFRRWTGVRGHGANAGHLHRDDDRVLSARAQCGVDVAMDGARRGLDDREHERAADRRDPRHRTVGVPPCAPPGVAARRAPCADARRRAAAPHLPDRSAHRDPRRVTSSCFIRPKRRRWPAT